MKHNVGHLERRSLPGVEVEVDSEVEEAEVRVEVRVEDDEEEVVVELPLVVLIMVALEVALVAEADEADEVMVSDDRVVETEALEAELEAAVVAAPLPWKVN